MLIDKKKDAHRGSYRDFLKARQPIMTQVKLKSEIKSVFLDQRGREKEREKE